MKIQVNFVLDLLELYSNRIKECYWQGRKDYFTKSICKGLIAKLDKTVLTLWKQFLDYITNSDQILTFPVNTLVITNINHTSLVMISEDNNILKLSNNETEIFYKLNTKWGRISMNSIIPPEDSNFH